MSNTIKREISKMLNINPENVVISQRIKRTQNKRITITIQDLEKVDKTTLRLIRDLVRKNYVIFDEIVDYEISVNQNNKITVKIWF